jgi:hypothetical protein
MQSGVIPVGILTAQQVRSVLLAATAAPSLRNSQPWRFHCTSSSIELHADPSRAVWAADPDHRELLLSCGAALMNLRLAIRAQGVHPEVRVLPSPHQPDLLAVVRPQTRRAVTPTDRTLANAIPRRRTNRKPFDPVPIPASIRSELRRSAEIERAWLAILTRAQLPVMRAIVHRAHLAQQADPAFAQEWAAWTGRDPHTPDGIPRRNSGPRPEPQDEWVLRDVSAADSAPRATGHDVESDPLIVVVGSFQDLPASRIQAGQAMERVLLTATTAGFSASFLSQVLEVPETRKELRELLGGGLWPQTVLRLGHGSPAPATPRRNIEDVVTRDMLGTNAGQSP